MISLATKPNVSIEPLIDRQRTIESFTDSECWNVFETRKEDLQRLLLNLRFPEKCVLENRTTMPGEEVMLRGLFELVSGADQHEIVPILGRDQTQQSRAFKYFVDHIYDNFLHLVTDNLAWWYENEYLHMSRDAIGAKFGGNEHFSTFSFIDCNKLSISIVEPSDILHLKIVEELITTKNFIVTNKSNSGRQEVGHRFSDLPVNRERFAND